MHNIMRSEITRFAWPTHTHATPASAQAARMDHARARAHVAEGAGHMTTILCERMKKMACLKVIVVLLAVFATSSVAGPVPLVLWHGMGEWKHHYEIVQRQIFHDHFCNFVCSPLQVTAVASRSVWVT